MSFAFYATAVGVGIIGSQVAAYFTAKNRLREAERSGGSDYALRVAERVRSDLSSNPFKKVLFFGVRRAANDYLNSVI